jgi:F-type H+-transporting ATPase subunit gamma
MPSTRDLRRRIRSVKNTAQITKAMQMVSAAKMKKAQNQALSARPYTQTLSQILERTAGKIETTSHPLLAKNESGRAAIVVCSTNKGLAGSLNTNVLRFLQTSDMLRKSVEDLDFYTVGTKGRDFLVRTRRKLVADFENLDRVTFGQAVQIRKVLVDEYQKGNLGEIFLLFPDFVSTLRQEPKMIQLLPVDPIALEEFYGLSKTPTSHLQPLTNNELLVEPDLSSVLDYAIVHFLDTQIYQALLETKASEHSARMIAMQNATNNAKDLVEDLTLTYNQLRQENITRELLEITSAGLALE